MIKTIVAGETPPRLLTGLKGLALVRRDLEKRHMAKVQEPR